MLPDENGIATATISIKDHNYKYGEYETHIYVYDNEGMSNKVSAGKFVINEPVTTAPIISNTYIAQMQLTKVLQFHVMLRVHMSWIELNLQCGLI